MSGITSEDRLRIWCIDALASLLDLPPSDIAAEASFESLGLDSANSVQFILALEDELRRPLDPDLVVAYPSIAALAHHLAAGG